MYERTKVTTLKLILLLVIVFALIMMFSNCKENNKKFLVHPSRVGMLSNASRMMRYDLAPERKGEIAVRESLEPEGSLMAKCL